MKKLFKKILISAVIMFAVPTIALAFFSVPQGGTGVGTITGIIKGNGTSPFSVATPDVDYQTPINYGDPDMIPFMDHYGADTFDYNSGFVLVNGGFLGVNNGSPNAFIDVRGQEYSTNYVQLLGGNSSTFYNTINMHIEDTTLNDFGFVNFSMNPEEGISINATGGVGAGSPSVSLQQNSSEQSFLGNAGAVLNFYNFGYERWANFTTGKINIDIDQSAETFVLSTYSEAQLLRIDGGTQTVAIGDTQSDFNGTQVAVNDNTQTINLIASSIGVLSGAVSSNSLLFTDGSKNLTSTGSVAQTQGGTGVTAGFSDGSVVFQNGATAYGQDNAYFFYDDTNHRLRLGSGSSPSTTLQISESSLAATPDNAKGLFINNTTNATVGTQVQISPAIRQLASGWKTNATAGPQNVEFRNYVVPVTGAANPTGYWTVENSINSGAFAEKFRVGSDGNVSASGNFVPDANDGAGLGTSALQFSDLFLAEGGVIDWDNTDATLTQAGNNLTLAGAQFINTTPLRLAGYTVATLPAGAQGDTAFVTDALAPTFLTAVVGGGAIKTPVFHDGTNWVAY